jgi:hypothetical protein
MKLEQGAGSGDRRDPDGNTWSVQHIVSET